MAICSPPRHRMVQYSSGSFPNCSLLKSKWMNMKQHSFLSICLTFCLILSGCSTKPVVTSSPTVSTAVIPSPTAKPLAAFSSSSIDHIVEQSELGKGRIVAGEFSPDGKRFGAVTPLGVYIYDVKTL